MIQVRLSLQELGHTARRSRVTTERMNYFTHSVRGSVAACAAGHGVTQDAAMVGKHEQQVML